MNHRPVIVIGAGGHAKVVVATLLRLGRTILGLADAEPERSGTTVLGVPVRGDDAWVLSHPAGSVDLALGLASVGLPKGRRAVFERFSAAGYRFATLVDPSAVIGPEVTLGEGAQVMAGAVVQPSTTLGVNALVNTGAAIDHDCVVGDHCHRAPGCVVSGFTRIGAGSHLGTGAVVIQGIVIGAGVVVAAGAVVVEAVADGAVVMGNPARARGVKA